MKDKEIMKKVFRFKKGEITDWDEPIMHFIEEYLTDSGLPENNFFPKFKKNWKVTIIVEEEQLKEKQK